MASTIADLLGKSNGYLPRDQVTVIEDAYRFADDAHRGQFRRSGGPYIEHPLAVAMILADLRQDSTTIASALLHDTLEDCDVPLEAVEVRFGPEIGRIVEGVTKLNQIEWQTTRENGGTPARGTIHSDSLRKMLVAMAEDVRVIIVKLADRLHNMRTIRPLPLQKQLRIARETLDVYAPLAHRLGIATIGWQLEDLCFRCLDRSAYARISKLLSASRNDRERFIHDVVARIRAEMRKASIHAQISGRPKHIYSIFQKMERYAEMGRDFDQIYDLFGFRILVDDITNCYKALGVVHSLWHPVPGEFDDYIANPRENGYQSLHTAVVGPDTTPFEIQIRTFRMHEVAEHGIAAHYRYKEGDHADPGFDDRMNWMRHLIELNQEDAGSEAFIESVKTDIFHDQVFVYTPKGEVRELPLGATPLDFAYRIHTDLGHGCVGAKVNGKMVPLNRPLHNGDTVQIIAAKSEKGPTLDWLNPDLGYIKTAAARDKIKSWFRKRAKEENIERGRGILEKELRRLKLGLRPQDAAKNLGYETVDDLAAVLGSGALSADNLAQQILPEAPAVPAANGAAPAANGTASVVVMGMPNLLARLAECCHPLAGDPITGFVTRSRGVSVHRAGCRNVQNVEEPDRLIDVSWGTPSQRYTARVSIQAWDRVGLLSDIASLLSAERVNISEVRSSHPRNGLVTETLTLRTSGAAQLSRMLQRIENVRGVVKVERKG